MHKSATKCNETLGKWCKNKHGASKIIDTLETYQHAICPTYLEDQNLRRHRELKDSGTLPILARAGELTVQATHLVGAASRNRCLTAQIHFFTLDAQRVSVMVVDGAVLM
jgi:hypothetical protein